MGLGKTTQSGGSTWVTIHEHTFCVQAKEGDEGAEMREVIGKDKKKIRDEWVTRYGSLSGFICGGEVKSLTHSTMICIAMRDGDGEQFELQLNITSRVGESFMKFMPNIDLNKEVTFIVFQDNKNKDATVLLAKQDGEWVKSHYTKENRNGLPEWEKKEKMGKTEWDRTDYMNFLYQSTVDWFSKIGLIQECQPDVVASMPEIDPDASLPF